jgi:transcriptional regulator of arginine metabolism
MTMKATRHALILEIIQDRNIGTQEELAEELKKHGVMATQATISRDIKELRLIKTLSGSGVARYTVMDSRDDSAIDARLMRIFSESVLKISASNNMIIIHTITGSANAAAQSIDTMDWEEILGTLAGDDTIFVVARSNEDVPAIMARFRQITQ